jgi:FHA domain-containing protein/type VII secretion system (Wss) protein YukD
MPYAMVTIEIEHRGKRDLAVSLDVPSRTLAAQLMKQLGVAVRTGDGFAFFVKTEDGETRIPSDATLGQAGVLDGQQLLILREPMGMQSKARTVKAYLRTEAGAVLPLEADNVVIGRRDAEHQAPIDVDLSTHDPNNAVSRRHASIGREGMKYYLIDLESTNGTRLNGKDVTALQKMPLKDGDAIEFGRPGVRVTFVAAK